MRLFTQIQPNKAYLYFYILPTLTFILLLLGLVIFHSVVILFTFCAFMIIYIYFGMIWRLVIGKLTYDLTPQNLRNKTSFGFFIFFSIINFLVLPLLAGLFIIIKDDIRFIFGLLVILAFYGYFNMYFQFNFISKNISKIKHGEDYNRNEKPISWVTLSYFPMTAKKTQTVINDIFKARQ
jgi:hypothetical protein